MRQPSRYSRDRSKGKGRGNGGKEGGSGEGDWVRVVMGEAFGLCALISLLMFLT